MEIVVSEEARKYIVAKGGTIHIKYVIGGG